ncbi:MAG: efflux RND transporter periplasmic adaptor subunit [Pseudomonadota bacterium]
MKKRLSMNGRRLALLAVLLPLAGLFVWVVTRAGPLAPVPVVAATVEERALTPALFGIGTVAARYTYRIGPTAAGRVRQVNVEVGQHVRAGQVLGEMDPVDLDERIAAQRAAQLRARASVAAAEAQVADVSARRAYAAAQAERYEQLLRANTVSADAVEAKRQELQVAEAGLRAARANLEAARQELGRVQAEHDALVQQRANLRLLAPVDGLVTARAADPGTTLIAGQPVVELVDPASLWVNVRFDQLRAAGLRAGLPARIVLRSQAMQPLAGRVLRIEPLADAVTEEFLAKVVFDILPDSLPPIGELAEVTVAQTALPPLPVVPAAAVQRVDGRLGVWRISDATLVFTPVELGAGDLDGWVQVRSGLRAGERVVVYSQRALAAHHRIELVDRLPGVRT